MEIRGLQAYSNTWPQKFKTESERIKVILGERIEDIQHIGSTSIPGMISEPIIDIGVLVDSIEDVKFFTDRLETIGYIYKPERSSEEKIFLLRGSPVEYHLSVTSLKYSFWGRQLLFCDYLIRHPDFIDEYNNLKSNALATTPEAEFADLSTSPTYSRSKGEFVEKILQLTK